MRAHQKPCLSHRCNRVKSEFYKSAICAKKESLEYDKQKYIFLPSLSNKATIFDEDTTIKSFKFTNDVSATTHCVLTDKTRISITR